VRNSNVLKCGYCGFENPIAESQQDIVELDFRSKLAQLATSAEPLDGLTVKCQAGAAEVAMPESVTAHACPFCGSNVVATATSRELIKPR